MRNKEEYLATRKKWTPQIKGGEFRKWYGNFDYVVNWQNDGEEIRKCSGCRLNAMGNDELFFRSGITWSHTTSGVFGARYLPTGYLFNVEAPTLFSRKYSDYYMLGMMNSCVAQVYLSAFNASLHYLVGNILTLPIQYDTQRCLSVEEKVIECISASRSDWDSFEISWDFQMHPLVRLKPSSLEEMRVYGKPGSGYEAGREIHVGTIEQAFIAWRHEADERFAQLKANEEELNRMNGFPEDRLPKEFDGDYQVLLVANKYQTGFDQPKLCAMYVLKKLKGVSAVQTLSRLNRICPPFEKKTFVLDFVNTYEEITDAFAPFFTTTLLSNSVTPTAIYDLEAQIDAYAVLDPDDIEKANELLYKPNISSKDKQKLTFYFKRSKNMIEQYDLLKQHEIVGNMRHFIRFYEFLLQVSCFEDVDLHKKYNFMTYLLSYINIKHPGGGFNLDGKIKATNFVQKKAEEHSQSMLVAKPVVKLPTAESFGLTEAKEERLSQIIAEINSRTGKAYDNDVAVKAMLQIRDILMKSERLRTSAKNNTVQDFEFSYFDDIDDALIEGLEQNQDFFSLLLSNDEIKRQVLGIFTDEIYRSLREA